MQFNPKDLIKEGGYFSRPAFILLAGWIIVWIWYLLNGLDFMKNYPLYDYVAVPFLVLISGYYFGKYNFTIFTSEVEKIARDYKSKK